MTDPFKPVPPSCRRCGERRRIFEVEPGHWLCRWQGGCDHRVMRQEAILTTLMATFDQVDILRRGDG